MHALALATAARTARPCNVLVVDDNEALQQSAQALLTEAGMGCLTAADNITALCALCEHPLQLVLLDGDVGPLEPWQFMRLLQQHPVHSSLKVIYLSNRDDVVERARAQAAGTEGFLAKPFTGEELQSALAKVLALAP